MYFNAGITINGIDITDQGRGPISVDRDERSVIVDLANGRRYKYVKKVAKIYTLSWEMLAGTDDNTIDGHVGRDWLADNVGHEGELHTVTFRHSPSDSDTIEAFVTSYNEELIMRRQDEFFWSVSVTLEES